MSQSKRRLPRQRRKHAWHAGTKTKRVPGTRQRAARRKRQ